MLVHALDSDLSCLCVCVCACWSINLTSVCAGHGQSLRTHQHDSPECQEGNVVNHWCFSDRFCFFWWSKPPGNTFNAAALSFCPFALLSFCGDNSSTKFCVCACVCFHRRAILRINLFLLKEWLTGSSLCHCVTLSLCHFSRWKRARTQRYQSVQWGISCPCVLSIVHKSVLLSCGTYRTANIGSICLVVQEAHMYSRVWRDNEMCIMAWVFTFVWTIAFVEIRIFVSFSPLPHLLVLSLYHCHSDCHSWWRDYVKDTERVVGSYALLSNVNS